MANRKRTFFSIVLMLCGSAVWAQTEPERATVEDNDLQMRVGFDISKKIARGLEITWNEEFRMKNTLSTLDRIHSGIGLSYKVNSYFSVGTEYNFIVINHDGKKSTDYQKYWDFRHRVRLNLIASYDVGQWKFSLRERPQMTIRTDSINPLEKRKAEFVLRSRLKAQYKCRRLPLEPYVAFEVYNTLNAPKFVSNYVEKLRSEIGLDYVLNRRSSMTFYYRFDYATTKDVNLKKSTGALKSIITEKSYNHILGVFYSYKF